MTWTAETKPPFQPPLALASLSGQSDATWARAGAEYAGAAFLGGIAIDEPTRNAARRMVQRDRDEFLPPDPVSFVETEFEALASVPIQPAINVRTTTIEPLLRLARVCREYDAILEVNAHCRQEEMCATGAGQSLLSDTDALATQVNAASNRGVRVSAKVRTEVPDVDLCEVGKAVSDAGGEILHVDAMDSEEVVADIVDETDLTVVANNGVRDHETVTEYLDYGADAVSVGRPSDNPRVLARVHEAVRQWFESAKDPDSAGIEQ